MSDLGAYLAAFAAIAATVWGAIHGLQRLTSLGDRHVAVVVGALGIVSGLVVEAAGFVKAPVEGWQSWLSAAFFGLLAAFAGAGATDLNLAKAAVTKEAE
jgi:hypothetical protein